MIHGLEGQRDQVLRNEMADENPEASFDIQRLKIFVRRERAGSLPNKDRKYIPFLSGER